MSITLKAARVNKNLTRMKAAELLAISTDTLRNYENGKTFPNTSVIQKMETLYGMEYKDFIFLP
jgi:transcriptional regulator with XRE-family HTH domain